MYKLMLKKTLLLLLILLIAWLDGSYAQEYKIHSRGMLHETVFNTGDIGRPWVNNSPPSSGNNTNVPLMEWPSNSRTVINGITYDGQHNLLGGGIYLGANLDGKPGDANRIYSLCGGVGSSTPEVVLGKWVIPISITRTENFPVLENGDLNYNYKPDEAEEIITAKWATTLGVNVTRTSRSWSFPDYDDLIIYEYEFEYTGDTNGDGQREQSATLKDFMVGFNYGFAPSMLGYQRNYGEWKYSNGLYQGDNYNFWDAEYWLSYNLDSKTSTNPNIPGGKPEPDPILFKRFSQTGENGGGLLSPQAPGYCMLYYPMQYLAIVDPVNRTRNESEYVTLLSKSTTGEYYELDSQGRIKQPYDNKITTGIPSSSKIITTQWLAPTGAARWSGIWGSSTTVVVPPTVYGGSGAAFAAVWSGRAKYNRNQSAQSCSKLNVFGPYTFPIGSKFKFALAEVVGYGADSAKYVEGGLAANYWSKNTQWSISPGMNKKVVIGGQVMTDAYLTDFGYPDYVNSNVRTVQQVANKAFRAYLGQEPTLPVWPENNPSSGSYKIPVPCPAPAIELTNTATSDIKITWKRAVENFTHPRLMGALIKYKVYKSLSGMGPWKLVGTIDKGTHINGSNLYEYIDADNTFKVGESRYFAVTSVDDKGNESGKTNMIQFTKKIGSVESMGNVYVVPNPFVRKSGFAGEDSKIGFYGLPAHCTIRVFSYAGQLVETIEHDASDSYSTEWFQTTRNNQEIASGVYLYVVTERSNADNLPTGKVFKGKFVVIK